MKRQCYQVPEIRDENNNIIQEGTYGRTSPLVTIDNTGVLDYINNNLEALHDALLGDRVYVDSAKDLPTPGDVSVTYITGDSGEVYYYDPATATYIAINQGKEYAKQAEKSSAAAKTSEANAQSSASSASTSASSAKTSETNAKTSETNASASATTAQNWAVSEASPDGATDTDSGTGKTQSSRSWALESKANAQSASSSASTATTQASSANTSAANASKSATAASSSATNAASSATAAKNSATAAATSATNSANSASASAKSASNAKTSETNASSSATTAKNWAVSETSPDGATDTDSTTGKTQSSRTWALESKASAQSASSSASTATTQASSASTSAANASKSATAASSSATNAASSATSASGSASSAASSASSAASSASSASASATNAKAAMNTANTAASSASTSATNASTSASNAAKAEVAAKTAQAEAEKARNDANSAVTKLTGAMKYAGQVDNYSDLADVTKNKGDVWNIVNADPAHGIKAGDNVAWNGTDWDDLSGTVDLSIYAEKADYQKTITSATANGATITFNHKDGTTSTATVNNVASSASATNDAKGQKIDTTYEKIADATNVHTSLQNSINTKQDKLTFDSTPTANSSNPVTSAGIKAAIDAKTVDLSNYYTKTQVNTVVSTAKTEIEGKIPKVDARLSTTSENPVQNKVIKNELDTYAKKTEVTVKGVKVDGSTSPLVPDSSGVVTIPSADLSDYATKNYVQQLINTLSTVSVTQDSLTKALSIK